MHRRYLDSQRPWVTQQTSKSVLAIARIERYVTQLEPRFDGHPGLAALTGYPALVEADLLARGGDRLAAVALYDQAAEFDY